MKQVIDYVNSPQLCKYNGVEIGHEEQHKTYVYHVKIFFSVCKESVNVSGIQHSRKAILIKENLSLI